MTDQQVHSEQLAIIVPEQSLATAEPALNEAMFLTPAVTVAAAVDRQRQLSEIVSNLLVSCTDMKNFDGADYGVLPGTSTRTLFQPGAEKLALFFGLQVSLSRQDAKEDWDNGFFFYRYKATVYYQGREVTSIERSCHSREAKYAWVWVETPKPAPATVEEMKALGTGRNRKAWKNNQQTWVWQERRPNPDPWSLQFIIEAMSQKRAYVAVVKKALGATGFFAKEVDVEEFREDWQTAGQPPDQPASPTRQASPVQPAPDQEAARAVEIELKNHCLRACGNDRAKAAKLWAERYERLGFDERKQALLSLGDGKAAQAEPDTVDAEIVVESPENDALIGQIEALFRELRALGKSNEEITDQVARMCNGEIGLADMTLATLTALREGLTFWRDQIRQGLNKSKKGA